MPLLDTIKAGLARVNPFARSAAPDAATADGPLPGAIGQTGYFLTTLDNGNPHAQFPSGHGIQFLDHDGDLLNQPTLGMQEYEDLLIAARRAGIRTPRQLVDPRNAAALALRIPESASFLPRPSPAPPRGPG